MPLTFHLIPHTHWDREWYLPLGGFRTRLVGMVDDLIAMLGDEPEVPGFLLDGQTVLLEDYLAVRRDREHAVRELVRAGRIETGPWYVLADEQIPSAEALIRNLLLGTSDAARLGRRMDVLYSPDAFGHPAVLPLLAREFGIGSAVVWRGLDGGPAGGRDLFRWQAPGGADVLVYHLPPAGYEVGAGLPSAPAGLDREWRRLRDTLVGRAAGEHVAVFVGADHHWARPDLAALRDALQALEPEHLVRLSRLEDFLAAAATTEDAPVVEGELRWSYGYAWTLQGIHATRAHQKRANSRLELWLERYAEPLAALAGRHGPPALRPLLARAWRGVVQAQFHDALGGCASDAVALAVDERHREAGAAVREITRTALHAVAGHDPDRSRDRGPGPSRLLLWNPAARRRAGLVVAEATWFRQDVLVGPPSGRTPRNGPGFAPFALRTGGGDPLPVQVLEVRPGHERRDARRHYPDQDEVDVVRFAFRAPAVEGMGLVVLEPVAGEAPPAGRAARARGRILENDEVSVAIEPTGALTVRDRRTGIAHFGLLRLEDGIDLGDTYTWCPPPGDPLVRSSGPVRIRTLAAGPLVAAAEASWLLPVAQGTVTVRLLVVLHADDPVVRCTFDLDNRASGHRLRARLPLGLARSRVLAGTQFGAAWREPVRTEPGRWPAEAPAATMPVHRFAAAAGLDGGLALLMPGFFEAEWTGQGDLLVTLLRSVGELSRGDLATRPGHAGWPTATPLAQCHGRHLIDLALAPVEPGVLRRDGLVPALWEDVFLPLRGSWLRDFTGPGTAVPGVELEGTDLVCSAVKPAEEGDGIVLRCYNAGEEERTGEWRVGWPVRRAYRARADETILGEVAVHDARRIPVRVGPFGVATVVVSG